jgi:Bacillus haemolytic enterotoxin (HBL).
MTILALAATSKDEAAMEILQLEEKLTAYWNAVTLITANAHAIARTNLVPDDPSQLPDWWSTLSKNFNACKGHAQDWIDDIYPSLTRIPQAIINYDTAFQVTSSRLLELLADIEKNPTDALKAQFMSVLKYLLDELGQSMTDINETKDAIKTFSQQMAADHTALTTGSANIGKAIDDTKGSVAKLTTRIEFLKLEIERLNMQLTVAAISLTTAVTVSYALMSVAPYIAIAIAIIGIGVSAGFIIDALVRLKDAQNEIIADSARLAREQKLVVVLESMGATVSSMVVAINSITTHIDTVSSAWAQIEGKLKAVITKLESAKGRAWTDVVLKELDIKQSRTNWTYLRQYCERLQEAQLTQSGVVVPVKGAA